MRKTCIQREPQAGAVVWFLKIAMLFFFSMCFSEAALAEVRTLGDMAKMITQTFDSIGKLITASSYLAGLGFSIGAILKFKQHKDNPTQITIGAPIAMLFVAAAMLFLPSVLSSTGKTLFENARTAGPSGITFTPQ